MDTHEVLHENGLYSFFRLTETGKAAAKNAGLMEGCPFGFAPKLSPDAARKRLEDILRKSK
jgi:hypothetical protein